MTQDSRPSSAVKLRMDNVTIGFKEVYMKSVDESRPNVPEPKYGGCRRNILP